MFSESPSILDTASMYWVSSRSFIYYDLVIEGVLHRTNAIVLTVATMEDDYGKVNMGELILGKVKY